MTSISPLSSDNRSTSISLSLDSVFIPIVDELKETQELYRVVMLESEERNLLEKLIRGDGAECAPAELRVAAADQISRHLLMAEGKWVRAGLVLLAGGLNHCDALPIRQVAVSVELVHLATLVHDDIIDQAPMRRGMRSVADGWGNSIAVLLGDLLFSKAFKLLLASGSERAQMWLTQATGHMCLGEIRELQYSFRYGINEEEYLEMISSKTASLMAAASASGGELAELSENSVSHLRTYGHALGMAFQIVDDVLDYTSTIDALGKQQGVDIQNEKATLPLIHLFEKQPVAAQTILASNRELDEKARRMTELMLESGSIEYAYSAGRRYGDLAYESLRSIEEEIGPSHCIAAMEQLIDFVLMRER